MTAACERVSRQTKPPAAAYSEFFVEGGIEEALLVGRMKIRVKGLLLSSGAEAQVERAIYVGAEARTS
jgi:hypothetical protein